MGIILFDIYFAVLFVGCQRTWAQTEPISSPDQRPRDQLIGPIAILTGDGEFLRSL
jgi:hypothetical protein